MVVPVDLDRRRRHRRPPAMKAAVRRAPAVPELQKERRAARMERGRDLRPPGHLGVVVNARRIHPAKSLFGNRRRLRDDQPGRGALRVIFHHQSFGTRSRPARARVSGDITTRLRRASPRRSKVESKCGEWVVDGALVIIFQVSVSMWCSCAGVGAGGEFGDEGFEEVRGGGAGGGELRFQLVHQGHQLIHFGHDPELFGEPAALPRDSRSLTVPGIVVRLRLEFRFIPPHPNPLPQGPQGEKDASRSYRHGVLAFPKLGALCGCSLRLLRLSAFEGTSESILQARRQISARSTGEMVFLSCRWRDGRPQGGEGTHLWPSTRSLCPVSAIRGAWL